MHRSDEGGGRTPRGGGKTPGGTRGRQEGFLSKNPNLSVKAAASENAAGNWDTRVTSDLLFPMIKSSIPSCNAPNAQIVMGQSFPANYHPKSFSKPNCHCRAK
jgi:hypothetical protein